MNTLAILATSAAADRLNGPLQAIVADLGSLAQCDLDFDLRTPATGEPTEVHSRLAATVSNLNEVMKQMAEIAGSVHGLSDQIARANGDLARRTAEQADALAAQADSRAREGRDAVAKVVGAMESIGHNTQQIGGIISTI